MTEVEQGKRRVTRSPNYPSIDLGRAIERVRQLYSAERQHAMPALQAVRHWGYSSLNSPGGGQVAALARFGLIDDEGTKDERKVRVTDLAVKILEHPEEAERQAAVRYAALLPAVHRDMWEKYGVSLPSADTLKWFLTRERGFSENGAKDFIKEYRATVEFARLDEGDEDVADAEHGLALGDAPRTPDVAPPDQAEQAGVMQAPQPIGAQVPVVATGQMPPISFPLASGKLVSVSGLVDLTEGEWTQFIAVLTALKPSLVRAQPVVEDGQ